MPSPGGARVLRRLRLLPLLLAAALLNLLLFADGIRLALPPRAPARAADADSIPRVVVLGFDGVDERILREYLDQGRLPHLAALARDGAFAPLLSETPPESLAIARAAMTSQAFSWVDV